MANLISLKRRITAAQNVSKTTRAMQMIAASKLKRAQDAALAGKPYVDKLTLLAQGLIKKLDNEKLPPYMKRPNALGKTLYIVISPDKGLCGSLTTNTLRNLSSIDSLEKNPLYLTLGKKIESAILRLGREIVASFPFGTTLPSFDAVYPILSIVDDYFLNKKVSGVKILSSSFINIFSQTPKTTTLLPIELPKEEKEQTLFTLFEPSLSQLLPFILRHYLEMSMHQHLLESYASEQAARMIAMQNATDNAMEIASELLLEYNKGRQEKITNEILDIGGTTFAFSYE